MNILLNVWHTYTDMHHVEDVGGGVRYEEGSLAGRSLVSRSTFLTFYFRSNSYENRDISHTTFITF
jgi:hypothetical protein